jgi:hypothetical protein
VYTVSNHSDLSMKTIKSLKESKWLFWTSMKRSNEVKNTGVVAQGGATLMSSILIGQSASSPTKHAGGCVATRCQAQNLPPTPENAYDH